MSWKFDTERPIYAQIKDQIKERIVSGMYAAGSRLPSVRELAMEAAVNPNTMQRALMELEREGYIVTNRTAGRTVTQDIESLTDFKDGIARELTAKYIEKMEQLGYNREQIAGILAAAD